MRELEVVPGTVLLACQSKTDATLEKTGKTITANGNAVANELTPGLLTPVPWWWQCNHWVYRFGWRDDYLSILIVTIFILKIKFTIELWAYMERTLQIIVHFSQ